MVRLRCTCPAHPDIDTAVYDAGVPLLGICYGAQLVARDLGGEVAKTGQGEYGRTELHVEGSSLLFSDLPVDEIGVDESRRLDHRPRPRASR